MRTKQNQEDLEVTTEAWAPPKEGGKKRLLSKLQRYIGSMGITTDERSHINNECRRLEKKLEIRSIQPREYIFLNKMREALSLGRKPDLKTMAIQSGYGVRESGDPEVSILKDISPLLLSEILGFNQSEIEAELVKVMKQDEDLGSKIRAIEVASKILGVLKEDQGVRIQINSGIKMSE